jgi:hypothetical protein
VNSGDGDDALSGDSLSDFTYGDRVPYAEK